MMTEQRTIVLAVTAARSLALMEGMPEYLRDRGWAVHVVCSGGPQAAALGARAGVTVHELPMSRQPRPIADAVALARWVRLLRTIRPDVVSSGTPKAALLGMVAARFARVPTRIYVLRGLRLESVKSKLGKSVLASVERVTVGCATSVLAVSPSLLAKAVDLKLVPRDKISVIGAGSSNGVDVERFAAAAADQESVQSLRLSLGIREDVPVIGFVGRLTMDKGLATLAAARQILVDRGVDHQLLLIGSVDGVRQSDLIHTLISVGRPASVTGHVLDTSGYYPLMDLLCLPTLREGFPNVILEAAAAGVPSVTTTATGAIDAVVHGTTGLVCPVGDAQAFAESIARLLALPADERHDLGANAQRRALERFDREAHWERLHEYVQNCANTAQPN